MLYRNEAVLIFQIRERVLKQAIIILQKEEVTEFDAIRLLAINKILCDSNSKW